MQKNNFDSLRVFGALAVLLSHCWPIGFGLPDPTINGTPLGTLGVYVFFCISGYLITGAAERATNFKNFVVNRGLRIYPGLIVCVVATIFILGPLMSTSSPQAYFADALTWKYLLNASAIKLQANLPGLFLQNPLMTVNGSLWTLPYEILSYAAAAMMVWLFPRQYRFAICVILVGLSFGTRWALQVNEQIQATIPFLGSLMAKNILKLFFPFFLGALLRYLRVEDPERLRWFLPAMAICLLGSILAGGVFRDLLFAAGACIAVMMVAWHVPVVTLVPKQLGDLSYGLYIYAFPVQQTLRSLSVHEWGLGLYFVLSTAIAGGLAIMSWRFIEAPALKLKMR